MRQIITKYGQHKPSIGDIQPQIMLDEEQGHYALVDVGWVENERVYGIIMHIDIVDGKIWLQHDGTNIGLVDELLEAGIAQEDIVLAWQHPRIRQYSDFAVA